MTDCRLYLITPPRIDDADAFARALQAALTAGGETVAALQIRLKDVDEAHIRANATQDLQLLLAPLGRTYRLGQVMPYATRLPSPMGGEPIAAQASFVMTAFNEATGIAQVSWTQAAQTDALARSLAQGMQAMSASLGRSAPDEASPPAASMNDQAQFTVNARSGWPVAFTHTRTVLIGTSTQVDTHSVSTR